MILRRRGVMKSSLAYSEEDPSKMWNFNYFNVSSSWSRLVNFERNFSDISSSSKCFFNFHRRHHHLRTLTCDDDSRDTFPSQRWCRYSFFLWNQRWFPPKREEWTAPKYEKNVCVLVLVDDHAIGMLPNWFILNSTGLAVREKCFVFSKRHRDHITDIDQEKIMYGMWVEFGINRMCRSFES